MMLNNFLSDELTHALGWTVFHSFWQAALIAGLLYVLFIGMKKQTANTRYWVANGALGFLFLCSLGTFAYYYNRVGEGFVFANTLEITINSGQDLVSNQEIGLNALVSFVDQYSSLIVGTWLLGMVLLLARFLGGWAYLYKMKASGSPLAKRWSLLTTELKKRIDLEQTVLVMESSLATVPMVLGYLRPIILFPIGVVNALPVAQVEAILAHELAHIKRHDFLLNIIQSVFEMLYYYHPAAWWISAQIRAERENCCDDIALSVCRQPLTYAKALANVEAMQRNLPPLALAFGRDKHQLLSRIKRILNQSKNNSTIMEKITASIMIALLISILTFSARASFNEKNETPNNEISPTVMADTSIVKRIVIETEDDNNGEMTKVRAEKVDGKVVKLNVNGQDIPPSDFGQHAEIVEAIESEPEPAHPPTPGTEIRVEKTKRIIVTEEEDENGKLSTIRGEIENGKVSKLKIDGKVIAPADYGKHSKVIEKLEKHQVPPPPPAPPAPRKAPKAPKAPKTPGTSMNTEEVETEMDEIVGLIEEKMAHLTEIEEVELEELERELHALEKVRELEDKKREKIFEKARKEAEKAHELANKNREKAEIARSEMIAMNERVIHMEMEELERARELANRETDRENQALTQALVQELRADGLIDNSGKLKFELERNSLKINGKKQPDHVYEKYKSFYPNTSDLEESTGETKVKIKIN